MDLKSSQLCCRGVQERDLVSPAIKGEESPSVKVTQLRALPHWSAHLDPVETGRGLRGEPRNLGDSAGVHGVGIGWMIRVLYQFPVGGDIPRGDLEVPNMTAVFCNSFPKK